MNSAARLLALLLGHEARITSEQWREVRDMNEHVPRLLMYEGDLPAEMLQEDYDEWFRQSFVHDGTRIGPALASHAGGIFDVRPITHPCPACEAAARELADLRARLEALCVEMETDDRAGKLAHWIISLRKIAEKEAGENGMDILDRAIDRIEEHSWTQDGPMSDEDDAAIDLLKECREAAERELYAQKEAK